MTSAPYQLLPPLAAQDMENLRQSIAEHGILQAVHIDDAGNVLDGHHRVAIAAELGIKHYPMKVHHGLADWEKRTFARTVNFARRHLTQEQKRDQIEGQLRDTPSLSDRAIAARLGVDHKTIGTRRAEMEGRGEIPHVAERTDTLGRSQPVQRQKTTYIDDSAEGRAATVARAKQIRAEAQRLSHEMRMAKHAAIKSAGVAGGSLEALAASGPFSVIYADPPWQQDVWGEVTGNEKSAVNHYPTASLEQICSHAPPVADDALLFLWATANNLVVRALPVMAAWGFEYVTQLVWDKVTPGTGRWVRDRHEILLIGKRGQFPCPLPGTQPDSLYGEKKGGHSAKPDWFRAEIVKMTEALDASQRLEMYARADHPDFERWGFEA